jgi:hypothetical protein
MHRKKNVVPSMPLAKTFVVGEVMVEVNLVQLEKLFFHFCIICSTCKVLSLNI